MSESANTSARAAYDAHVAEEQRTGQERGSYEVHDGCLEWVPDHSKARAVSNAAHDERIAEEWRIGEEARTILRELRRILKTPEGADIRDRAREVMTGV